MFTAWGRGRSCVIYRAIRYLSLNLSFWIKKRTGNTRAALTQGGYLGYLMLQKMDVPGTAIT